MTDLPDLRTRLTRLRRDALRQLGLLDAVDPGLLRLVADATIALQAIDQADRGDEADR